jgi:hypothetical protein
MSLMREFLMQVAQRERLMRATMLERPHGKIVQMTEQVYIPVNIDTLSDSLYLLKTIPLAVQSNPNQVCGVARRVGYIYRANVKQPMYRLKLRQSLASKKTATLPGFYILVNGVFVRHEP